MTVDKEQMESVMRRLEKLLAISKDTRGNANEAAAAASMAARIMLKYQISEAEAIISSIKKGNDMGMDGFTATFRTDGSKVKEVPAWASCVGLAVAKLTGVRASLSRNTKQEAVVLFMGYIPDVKTAIYTMKYLSAIMRKLRIEFMTTETYKSIGLRSLNSYTKGLSTGIASMINDKIEEMEDEFAGDLAVGTVGNQLMVVKSSAVDDAFGPQASKTASSTVSCEDSAVLGHEHGKNIKLVAPIETSATPTVIEG